MQMSGERRIPAPREKVWEALNDPEVLKQSIPGCQSLEKDGDDSFSAKVKAKVGPVSATSVKLEEDGSDTILKYDVDAKVGGKLAQIGSRLVDGTARKLSEEFFDNFSAIVGGGGAAAPASEEPQAEAAEPTPAEEPAAQETASEEPVAPAPAAAAPAEPQPEASSGSATPDRKGLPAIVWIAGLVAAVAALLYLFTAN
ncbi:MAG: carbon monoxide dehydrogenase subunit G [Limibacillus sp.]